jgi:hypothetical protein
MAVERFAADTDVKHTVVSWIQTSDKKFLTRQNTNVGITAEQIRKCQWRLRGVLMCNMCHVYIVVRIKVSVSESLLPYLF